MGKTSYTLLGDYTPLGHQNKVPKLDFHFLGKKSIFIYIYMKHYAFYRKS